MMDVRIERRALLRAIGGVAAGAAATSFTACGDRADRKTKDAGNGKTLVVRDIGGAYGEANRKAVYEPFSKETGIRVSVVTLPLYAQMLAQIREGRPQFDVIDIDMSALARFERDEATQELDYDRLKSTRNAGIAESLLTSHGVGKNYWASVMAFRTDAFGGKTPQSWADFWDTGAFPGRRALQGPDAGPPELEFALLADGVAQDRLYPLDVDRAFRALDEIKSAVREFWADGATPGLLLQRGHVVASSVWHGRPNQLIKRGAPLAYQWNGARRQSNGFGIPNGARNVDAAYRLIDFALRPEVQADFAEAYPMGPVVPAAYKYLPRAAADLASSPEHLYTGFDLNVDWWVQNKDAVTKRWQEWARS
ncbi:ABC transporter substrate-binding protein [Streptomyces viridochromogenes]|uniref:Putative Extracellular solute-binding protein n=1 Tax=Streptomyces viridochromogenes Tue57 TaxID=1160705 RepID=L8PP81_STRVR|nr:putative Extracellular solute-binding protein [Streptomyces viridochromogenes Tue57]